jgi:hypothetical protein
MKFVDALNSDFGSFIISMILGLGLAAMFQDICKGDGCIVLEPPNHSYVTNNIFQFKEGCYKFDTVITECDENKKTIQKSK